MSNIILAKMRNMSKANNNQTSTKVEMTDKQVQQCKNAIREKNRGYNVHPNRFDLSEPYRVAINYNNEWNNFGNFKSADVAAAVGSVISVAFFGDKAVAGTYDEANVDGNEEFTTWLADARNTQVIAMYSGDAPTIADGGSLDRIDKTAKSSDEDDADDEVNPF